VTITINRSEAREALAYRHNQAGRWAKRGVAEEASDAIGMLLCMVEHAEKV
jgi:hypothetical protein